MSENNRQPGNSWQPEHRAPQHAEEAPAGALADDAPLEELLEDAPQAPDLEALGLVLRARGLQLAGRESMVFGPLDMDLPRGSIGMVVGQQGAGRSALLLALAGRLKGVQGSLRVGGIDAIAHPRALRKQVSVARIGGLVELEPNLTVGESRDERAIAEGIGPRRGRERFAHLEELLGHRFEKDQWVDRMPAVERTLLTLVLGCLSPALLVVVDDLDDSLTAAQMAGMLEALALLVADGNQFVVSAMEHCPLPAGGTLLELPPPPARAGGNLLLRFPPRRSAHLSEDL